MVLCCFLNCKITEKVDSRSILFNNAQRAASYPHYYKSENASCRLTHVLCFCRIVVVIVVHYIIMTGPLSAFYHEFSGPIICSSLRKHLLPTLPPGNLKFLGHFCFCTEAHFILFLLNVIWMLIYETVSWSIDF